MAITTKKPAQATKKDTTAPAKKAPAKMTATKAAAKPVEKPAKSPATSKAVLAPKPTTVKAAPAVKAEKPKAAPAKAKPAPKAVMASAPAKDTASEVKARKAEEKAKEAPKKAAPKPKNSADLSKMANKIEKETPKTTSTGKTAYHVSKRDNDGREWKVFIQGSDKVIKLFKTQAEALDYAKTLAKNKDDGSYVLLHGLDGKIRRY